MLLSYILPKAAKINPSAFAFKQGEEAITYAEANDKVASLAEAFKLLGLRPGDRVALLGHPCIKLALAELAAVAVGAIPFAVFPISSSSEIEYILYHGDPTIIVYDAEQGAVVKSLSCPGIQHYICCSERQEPGHLTLEKMMNTSPSLTEWHRADPKDIAVIIYTGGTTGKPKGVMHSHQSILSWLGMASKGYAYDSGRKVIGFNLAHLTGQTTLWMTLLTGGTLIYLESYPAKAEEVATLIERERVTLLGTVGRLLRDIIHLPDLEQRDFRSVKGVTCGGSTISMDTLLKAIDVFPTAGIFNIYSQTECGMIISRLSVKACVQDNRLDRLQSVGSPSEISSLGQKPFSVRIVDEFGQDVAPGDIGEIVVQGEQVMVGYWNDPDASDRTLRDDWIYTGDIGRLDEDGYLYLIDRKKDMIIVGGLNVYSVEVEEVIGKHPAVQEAAIVGVPLAEEGEEVAAAVILKPGHKLDLNELTEYCSNLLAPYKIPTRFAVVESLPKTSVDKIDKKKIRDIFRRFRLH